MLIVVLFSTITAMPARTSTARFVTRRVIAGGERPSSAWRRHSLLPLASSAGRCGWHSMLPSGEIRIADQGNGTVYRRRPLQMSSEYKLDAVSLSPPFIDIFPSGVGSAGFSVSLTNGAFQRQVAVTRTGVTRVLVP